MAADVGAASAQRKYSGYAACARELMQHSGMVGFYRGFGVSFVGVVLFKAMFLGGYDISKALMGLESKEDRTTALSLVLRFSAAQAVTTFCGAVCYPLDTLRRLIMMQKRSADGQLLYTNSWQCAQVIWKRDGFKGFYVGFTANLVRGIGGAFLLVGYDEVQKLFRGFS